MSGWSFEIGDAPPGLTSEQVALLEALASEAAALEAQTTGRAVGIEVLRPRIARLRASGMSIDRIAAHGRLPRELVEGSLR